MASTSTNNFGGYYQALQHDMDLDYCCDVMDVARNATSMTPTTPTPTSPKFDINDPLRYGIEIGEIDKDEYETWKIVKVPTTPTWQEKQTSTNLVSAAAPKPRHSIDFGPGYNSSDSETDNDIENLLPTLPTHARRYNYRMVYGHGYAVTLHEDSTAAIPIDVWFPHPDPTPNKQYTQIAASHDYIMSQFILFENDPCDIHGQPPASISRLKPAFQLKILWERFTQSKECRFQSLQEFWQNNSLAIYEALQDLVEMHASCFNPDIRRLIRDSPEFHTTPLEMLENTYETIGRMSRCIAEDFNDQTVHTYVDEFIQALYVELRFMDLVQARVDIEMDAEYKMEMQRAMMRDMNDGGYY